MTPDPYQTDLALESQDDEEIVEIDEYGRVYRPDDAPRRRRDCQEPLDQQRPRG